MYVLNVCVPLGFIVFLLSCAQSENQQKGDTMKKEEVLRFEVVVPEISNISDPELRLLLKLTNVSDHPVLVNSRLAVGFEDQISREVFFEIVDQESNKLLEFSQIDINREDPGIEDYRFLKPDESISKDVNLRQFYAPLKKGKFLLTAYYEADEEAFRRPDEVVSGRYSSTPKYFEVK